MNKKPAAHMPFVIFCGSTGRSLQVSELGDSLQLTGEVGPSLGEVWEEDLGLLVGFDLMKFVWKSQPLQLPLLLCSQFWFGLLLVWQSTASVSQSDDVGMLVSSHRIGQLWK